MNMFRVGRPTLNMEGVLSMVDRHMHRYLTDWSSGKMIILIHEGAFGLLSEIGSSSVGFKGL